MLVCVRAAEGDCVGVVVAVRDTVPVFDALAPGVRLAVGDALTVEVPLSVEDGVMLLVPVLLSDGVDVCVLDGVGGGVTLLERETLAEADWLLGAKGDDALALGAPLGAHDGA